MAVQTYSLSKDGSKKLSANFSVAEFKSGGSNNDKILIDSDLVNMLQRIRDHFKASIRVTSGYRTAAYNKSCGGITNSNHLTGKAADIVVSGKTTLDVAKCAESLGAPEVIQYTTLGFVHIGVNVKSYKGVNTNGVLKKITTFGGSPPQTSSTSTGKLAEDGYFGSLTVKRWQQIMGTPADGIISGQATVNKSRHQASTAIQYGSGGSSLVRAVQKKLGTSVDGQLGPNTISAIQRHLGVTVDGYFAAKPSETVRALQKRLNTGAF